MIFILDYSQHLLLVSQQFLSTDEMPKHHTGEDNFKLLTEFLSSEAEPEVTSTVYSGRCVNDN